MFLWWTQSQCSLLSRGDVESCAHGSGVAGPHRECWWQRKKVVLQDQGLARASGTSREEQGGCSWGDVEPKLRK